MNRSRDDVAKADQRKQVIFWSVLSAVLFTILFGCTAEAANWTPVCTTDLRGNRICTGAV